MRMKKFLAFISALCMACAVVPVLPVQETAVISASAVEHSTYENLKYDKYEEYIEITGVTVEEDTITELHIPAEIDGLPVTSIGWDAFCECKSLTSVTIPDSVTSIGDGAFYDCTSLTSVTIPESVTSIGDRAFEYCESLTSVTIPSSVTSIGVEAFYGTPWLEAKQEENPLVVINHILIDGTACEGDVTIPDSVTSIGLGAFEYCESTSVTIPDSVTSIGAGAFYSCTSLTSVTILNPECKIGGYESTFSNDYNKNTGKYEFNGTIYGYEGSTAQAYAEKYNRNFALIGSEPETETLKQGDASGDGEVDILDVITINKAILGKENLSENGLKAIDFNGNGKPDSDEALTLLKYIVGLITDFNA